MSTAERRARELERRERTLLDAAVALLDRDDWQAVTVEAIAERAEYAKGTVYRHFASKDDLYARLAADWTAGTCAALEALDADRPFEAVLRDLVAVTWRRTTGDRVHARLLARVRQPDVRRALSPEARRLLEAADARLLGLFAGTIDLGVAEGAIPPAPLEPRLFIVAALLAGATDLADQATLPDPERRVADAILATLRAP
jgi:AcrR family transcriptional regulator